jgi:hypothetical protein
VNPDTQQRGHRSQTDLSVLRNTTSHHRQRMRDTRRYWFSTPQFGFGFRSPITWEGWAFDVATFVVFVAAGLWIRRHPQEHPMLQLGLFFGVLAANLAFRHCKGEPRSWA